MAKRKSPTTRSPSKSSKLLGQQAPSRKSRGRSGGKAAKTVNQRTLGKQRRGGKADRY